MSKLQICKRATIKDKHGDTTEQFLFRHAKGDYRWADKGGNEFDGVAYLSEEDAIRAIRCKVEGEPEYVGADLTIFPVDPPPHVRAAEKCFEQQSLSVTPFRPFIKQEVIDMLAGIIEKETNIATLLDAYQTLLAHCFQRRRIYAKAQFPTVEGQEPRDLVFDGLLLTCIEETEKATRQNFDNLKKILMEPSSRIVTAHGVRKKGTVQS